ncbi:MAG: hypothetical protein JO334_15510 [Verrucomicrobia bacterium]|nr:hypothetical protein [Verrucomicrobiota bacterium]
MRTSVEGQSLSPEDQLFILMQAGLYLTVTCGQGSPEARICYERAEPLCYSLHRPMLLYLALIGQWRYSLLTGKMSTTLQIAKYVYSLAQEQKDAALMIGAYRALAVTHFYLGDFQAALRYAVRGVQIWRTEGVPSHVEEVHAPAVVCLCIEALSKWHIGEITSCHATLEEAISLARELNDMHALANALTCAAILGQIERNPTAVERLASDVIELATRHNFENWLQVGGILLGWARAASGDAADGIPRIESGIRGTGWVLVDYYLALKAEALHLAGRTSEALEAISEAEALVERFEERWWCAELRRLRGIFLTAIGAADAQIESSFREAIRIAKEQKSISLTKRAEEAYAQYRNEKNCGKQQ